MDMVNMKQLLVLAVCCLCHLIWGSITISTYYVNAFKVQYNYTQSQVEAILPLLSFGRILCPVPAVVYQTWGLGPTLLWGLTLSSGGLCFLWGSGFFLDICYMYPVIIYACFFIIGFGSSFLNLSIITTVTMNVNSQHLGKATSAVLTCYAISPVITLFIYRKWFAQGRIEDDARQDLHGFMLYFAFTTAVVGIFFLCITKINVESVSSESALVKSMDSVQISNFGETSGLLSNVLQELQAVFGWPLQMMVWSFAITQSIILGIEFNLSLYSKLGGVYGVSDKVFVMFHAILCLSRLAVGFTSDALAGIVPRTFYLAVTSFLLAVCLCVMSIFPTTEFTMYMLSVTLGLAAGVAKPVLVTVLVQNMGKENFARNWGIAYSLTSVSLTAWAAMFSGLYSAAGGRKGEDCYGSYCLRWINVATSVMAVISTCCSLALTFVKRY